MSFRLIDPITKGTIHTNVLSKWQIHEIMRSTEEHENQRWESKDLWIDQTDPLFKDERLNKVPLSGGFELRDQSGNLFDFVRVKFSAPFINDGDRIKICAEMWLEPVSNIEFCQLILKKEGTNDDQQRVGRKTKKVCRRNGRSSK
jgi:hypothetical protein